MSNNEPQRCLRCKRLLVNEKVPVCARCFRSGRRVGSIIGGALGTAGIIAWQGVFGNSDDEATNSDECSTNESFDIYSANE